MYLGSLDVNTIPGPVWKCFKVEKRQSGEEEGAGKAEESKVKTPVAAHGSFWQPHQKQRTEQILQILSLDGRRS